MGTILANNEKLIIEDLVSNYGVDSSLNRTADCVRAITESKILDKIQSLLTE